ncbi:uncharacterized protein EI97DRAFT_446223 [Westerdykella ornata]|uniref:Uncharacterized protein n=1 Tax=Westerdykella ornata TaxID=318751 RepID=A0A6A6J6C3_WESOR|nr:uncharacterized protein EI97DRAFT_446223 [Westerdykella ornata]KAF2271942.1 hypothetical protein EI97DRAFT_446223 [Westerdykella ornata]
MSPLTRRPTWLGVSFLARLLIDNNLPLLPCDFAASDLTSKTQLKTTSQRECWVGDYSAGGTVYTMVGQHKDSAPPTPDATISARHSSVDHVRNLRHQNGTPVQTSPHVDSPEDPDATTARINTEITSLLRRQKTPHSRYPPFHSGNGTYTHVLRPSKVKKTLAEQKEDPSTLQVLPLAPSARSDRSARSRVSALPDEVTAAFEILRKALADKEKIKSDTLSPFDRFQALPLPNQGVRFSDHGGSDDTTMNGISSDGERRNGWISLPSSRKNSVADSLSSGITPHWTAPAQGGSAQAAQSPAYMLNVPRSNVGQNAPPSNGITSLAEGRTTTGEHNIPSGPNNNARGSDVAYNPYRDPRRRGR